MHFMYKLPENVLLYDHRRFINDDETPLSFCYLPARIIRRYNKWVKRHYYEDLIDVVFEHNPTEVSCGHLTMDALPVRYLKIEGESYPILRYDKHNHKELLTILNENRHQYETYSSTQNPKIVPLGADEYDIRIAVALAVDHLEGDKE